MKGNPKIILQKMEKKERIKSIDVLRGLTVATMIMVNNPGTWGAIYPPLKHAAWSGCTPTDLVFPFFMFIVGCSMWFVFSKAGHRFAGGLGKKVIKRAVMIYLVGFLLAWYPFFSFPMEMAQHSFLGIEFSFPSMKNLETIRIMGVLPRIGLAYGLTGLLILGLKKVKYILIASAVILLAYWGILHAFYNGESYMAVTGNAAQRFDLWILGAAHMYKGYGAAFDPEGLLSTLPSMVNIILGYMAGRYIGITQDKLKVSQQLMFWGALGTMVALGWDLAFPINKPLWTSSYVLFTCGWASMLLGMLIYMIDVRHKDRWTNPALVFGMNPLFIFVLAGLVAKTLSLIKVPYDGAMISLQPFLFKTIFIPLGGLFTDDLRLASLFFAIFYIVVFWLIARILYVKKIFIKL